LSALGEHLGASGSATSANSFYRLQPQVLRRVLCALDEAIKETVALLGGIRRLEPQFTRQLAACFEDSRDRAGGALYHIDHQGELPIRNGEGRVIFYRRLDIRLLFTKQVGRRGDYLCIECKYLDATDRGSDREYVEEGVNRIVTGEYALGHRVAIMIGLERIGPLSRTIANVHDRLTRRYGEDQGLRPAPRWKLCTAAESEHPQAGGPHRITIVHGFWPITATARPTTC
jgi:hypothetical protein